ncbi:hypothetical protein E4U41_004285 [Claviceps citrina]|nr:hypothetical protein E4U41_004285 [Claviceps citrina]
MRVLLALLPLLALGSARRHRQCSCYVYDPNTRAMEYHWELTAYNCKLNFGASATYDHGSGHCIAKPKQRIDGDRWEADCKQTGEIDGYMKLEPDDTFNYGAGVIKIGEAKGHCYD